MSHARQRARQAAVQAIYQWQMTQQNLTDIEMQFRDEHSGSKTDLNYFSELLNGVAKHASELDEVFNPYLTGRDDDEVSPIEKAILRIGTYELKNHIDVPYKVVLNEAVNLAKRFGADQAHKFVNSILDRVAAQLRSVEVKAAKK